MASDLQTRLDVALHKRREYLLEHIEEVSMRDVRRLLEQDLRMPPKSLDDQKKYIETSIDKVLESMPAAPGDAVISPSKGGGKHKLKAKLDNGTASRITAQKAHKGRKSVGPNDQADENDEVDEPSHKAFSKRRSKTVNQGSKAPHGSDDSDSSNTAEEEEEAPAWKKSRSDRNADEAQKQNISKQAAPTPRRQYSALAERIRGICKQATIGIPPSLYSRNKEPGAVEGALRALLAKHGLDPKASSQEIQAVKRRLATERDLDGINASNIIEHAGGRPRRAAAAQDFKAIFKQPKYDDESEASSSSEEQGLDRPSYSHGKGGNRKSGKAEAEASLSKDEEDCCSSESDGNKATTVAKKKKSNGPDAVPAKVIAAAKHSKTAGIKKQAGGSDEEEEQETSLTSSSTDSGDGDISEASSVGKSSAQDGSS